MTATGNNYAEALFMLAREENLIDEFYDGLKLVEEVFKENIEYIQFLSNPSISKSERITALKSVFEGKIHGHILSFLQLICEKAQAACFFDCVNEYYRLYEFAKGTVEAMVKSAVELTDTQKDRLIKSLEKRTGKSVTLKCVVDNTLLGGVAVEIDGQLLDGSVKQNLKRAREVIGV